MSSRTNRMQKHTSNGSWGMVNVGLTILYAILALVLLFTMFNYNFLSFRFLNIIITIGLLVVLAISIFLQKTKKSPLVTTVVLVIFSLVSLVGIFGFKQMIDITNRINQTAAFSEVEMSIVVPKDSDIRDVSQITSVQAPTKVDKNNIDSLMSALKEDKKVDVKVDDGPKTLEESLDLIGESYAQGVRKIVSTSHRRKGMFETPENKIFANFSKVKAEALYPDLTIYYGGELDYTLDIVEKLEKNLIPRMHNTQFALIEFSARTSWKEIHSGLSNVLRAGVTPIVAHIERYDALEENADRVREIINYDTRNCK